MRLICPFAVAPDDDDELNTTTVTTTAMMTVTTFMTIMNIVESRVVLGTRRAKHTEGTGVQTRAQCRAQH